MGVAGNGTLTLRAGAQKLELAYKRSGTAEKPARRAPGGAERPQRLPSLKPPLGSSHV